MKAPLCNGCLSFIKPKTILMSFLHPNCKYYFLFLSDMSHINKNNNYALLSVEGEIKELLDNAH
jgi:hypothetical protein